MLRMLPQAVMYGGIDVGDTKTSYEYMQRNTRGLFRKLAKTVCPMPRRRQIPHLGRLRSRRVSL
jgi:hypothetical protein